MERGFYLLGPRWLGKAVGPGALPALQVLLWALQLACFFPLARALGCGPRGAAAAVLLFAWGTPLLRLVDAPWSPSDSIGRSLALTLALPSLLLHVKDRRAGAWAAAVGSFYLHANPGVYLLMMYGMVEGWACLRRRGRWGPFLARAGGAALALLPAALSELETVPLPEPYRSAAFVGLGAWPPIPRYAATDWVLFLEGLGFLWLARPLPPLAAAGGVLAAVSVLSRLLLPLPILIKLTSGFAYLWAIEVLGLVALVRRLEPARGWALAAGAAGLLASRAGDFLLRGAALAALRWPRRAKPLVLAAAAVALAWPLVGEPLERAWTGWTGRGGGVFALPAFSLLRPRGAPRDEAWKRTMAWFKAKTSPEAFVFLPCGRPSDFFDFLIHAERAAFPPDARYAAMLYEHGPAALPLAQRLERIGWDFGRVRTWEDQQGEAARVCRWLDRRRIAALGVTHVIARAPADPLPAEAPVYADGPYRVYRL